MQRLLAFLVIGALAGCTGASTTSTIASTTSTPAPTTTAPPATTTTEAPTSTIDVCDPSVVLTVADEMVEVARLSPSSAWTPDTTGSAFVDQVVEPESFASGLGLDCFLRRVSDVGGAHERLLLAAWTGERRGAVVLAVDEPTDPYAEVARFDLLFEQPWGEWVTDETWAVTVSSGESVILHTDDYPIGAVAKSFLVAFPEPTSPPPDLAAEEVAFAVLADAGGRNIGIAEPSDTEVASVAFMSPDGNVMIATIGPVESFDPLTPWLTGPSEQVDVGVPAVLTLPDLGQYVVADVGFVCDAWGWRLESSFGEPEELVEMAARIVEAAGCGG